MWRSDRAGRRTARPGRARPGTAWHGVAFIPKESIIEMNIEIRIEGVTPLMLNKFTDAAALAASSGTSGSSSAIDRGTPQGIAESKLYRGVDGGIIIPQPNLLRCLVDGGVYHKIGRSQVTTKTSSTLYGCLDIEAAEIPIEHQQPWRVDTRAVVIPATKGRILAHRPIFDDWALTFTVTLDTSIISAKFLRAIIDDAGKRVGLGEFRPSRKGPYGRFVVTRWEAVRERGATTEQLAA